MKARKLLRRRSGSGTVFDIIKEHVTFLSHASVYMLFLRDSRYPKIDIHCFILYIYKGVVCDAHGCSLSPTNRGSYISDDYIYIYIYCASCPIECEWVIVRHPLVWFGRPRMRNFEVSALTLLP